MGYALTHPIFLHRADGEKAEKETKGGQHNRQVSSKRWSEARR